MSSTTPLTLNYYQGRPFILPQDVYKCLPPAQIHPINPYQVYDSYLSDTRGGPGNIGSRVPTQQIFTQGNNYYQQPVSNVMLLQPQQSQAYHIAAQPQSNMRHSTPSHQPQMMFISQNCIPTSSVINVPSNMYPAAGAPLYPPNTCMQDAATCSNIEYYPNESPASCGTGIPPIAAVPPRPVQLNKKVLSIMDPDTGRDISVELFFTSTEQHHEEIPTVNQNDNALCQDRLKSPDHSNTSCVSSDSRDADVSASTSGPAGVPSNHQYQPPLFKQNGQQQQPSFMPAATVMRPLATGPHVLLPTHSGMPQQTSATATQPHNTQNEVHFFNLSMPPPQYFLRHPTQIWQQHQYPILHHFPAHTQPFQQPIKPLGTPVPQSYTVISCATDKQKPLVGATSPDGMPDKPTGPSPPSTAGPASVSSVLPQTVEFADSRPSSVKTISGEKASIIKSSGDISRAEASLDIISQDTKGGLNVNNDNKDFSSKEIGELDMGGFMGSFDSTLESKSNPVKTTVESNSVSLLDNRERDTNTTIIAKYVIKRDATSSCDIQSLTETSVKRDIKMTSGVREQEPAPVKLSNVDCASGESGKNNITMTNNTLDVTSVAAGPSKAAVQHSEQEVIEAKSVFAALAPDSTDSNAQRHVPVAESGDTSFDSGSSRDESSNAQQIAETQKQVAAPRQRRASKIERRKGKTKLKTKKKQKVNPCSTPDQYSEVQSEVVETDEKPTQLQLEHKSAGEDNKTLSVPIALLQELCNVTNVSVHTESPAQSDDTEKKVVPIMQTGTKPNVEASQSSSKSAAINISDPTKNQNQSQAEQTRNTAEINRRTQGQIDRHNSNTLQSGVEIAVHAEPAPTISINVVGDSFQDDYPFTDEDQTLESVPMQESEDINKGQSYERSSTAASRPSLEKTKIQTKRLQYDRAYLMKLRECAASQKKPELFESQDLEIIFDKPIRDIFRGSNLTPLDISSSVCLQTDNTELI